MQDRLHIARLNPKEERRLLRGHLWAYRNEFAQLPDVEDGGLVEVVASSGRSVGVGFYQAQGGIAVRLLARKPAAIDGAFFAERIAAARRFRETIFPDETVYRWVFGESDGLPGLVIDRYGAVVAVETACAFYGPWLDAVAEVLLTTEGVDGIRAVCCGGVHRYGQVPPEAACRVDGVEVKVRIESGQKTGLFLDQRANWPMVRRYACGARVLDGHCYVGLWSVHAALAGAKYVVGVDTSGQAIEMAAAHAEAAGVSDRCRFERADIEEVLSRGDRYDCIVLDPPAYAKSRAHERKALAQYQALNAAAMQALEPGGILITSSCSHFVSAEAFLETLKRVAISAQRQAWILDVRGAAPDHPVLMAMPETSYLKCVVMRLL